MLQGWRPGGRETPQQYPWYIRHATRADTFATSSGILGGFSWIDGISTWIGGIYRRRDLSDVL